MRFGFWTMVKDIDLAQSALSPMDVDLDKNSPDKRRDCADRIWYGEGPGRGQADFSQARFDAAPDRPDIFLAGLCRERCRGVRRQDIVKGPTSPWSEPKTKARLGLHRGALPPREDILSEAALSTRPSPAAQCDNNHLARGRLFRIGRCWRRRGPSSFGLPIRVPRRHRSCGANRPMIHSWLV